ncbi:MAG TPA: DUF2630 family protein [Acidimicrobiia bacterium]|nr:DUF2630 family protein [Acidimicrobiia bacterium]
MNDDAVLSQINDLVAEEHRLLESSRMGDGGLNDEEEARLKSVEVALDQCWDLLRQRRAARNAGRDPDDAGVRDADTVESYQQ